MELVLLGFVGGCVFTFLVLYLPSHRLHTEYQERLEQRLRELNR